VDAASSLRTAATLSILSFFLQRFKAQLIEDRIENWLRFAIPQLKIVQQHFSNNDLASGPVASGGGASLIAVKLEQFRQRPTDGFGCVLRF
jgi:hypothetical protein